MHSIYTTGKNKTTGTSHFSFWVGLVPYLKLLGRELFKKALCKYFEPFFEKSLRSHLHGQSTEGKWGYPNCGKIPERPIRQLP